MIDTQKNFSRLQAAGFSKEQAATLTDIAREVAQSAELVTKKDSRQHIQSPSSSKPGFRS
jgi:hypothetical protein